MRGIGTKIIEISKIRHMIYPDKWDEFLNLVSYYRPKGEAGSEKVNEDIIQCVSDAFCVPVEVIKGREIKREYNDARKCCVYFVSMGGDTQGSIAKLFSMSVGSVNYHKRQFLELYSSDASFNRKCHIALSVLFDKGYAIMKQK